VASHNKRSISLSPEAFVAPMECAANDALIFSSVSMCKTGGLSLDGKTPNMGNQPQRKSSCHLVSNFGVRVAAIHKQLAEETKPFAFKNTLWVLGQTRLQ
jgi:hypothetical protein